MFSSLIWLVIAQITFWTFSSCSNFDKNSVSLLKSNTDIAAIQRGKGVDLRKWDLKQLCNPMLSMIESRSQGLVQSSPAQHRNHMLCTTIDSHSFLPGVFFGGSWAYKGNHVRESKQQSSNIPSRWGSKVIGQFFPCF